MSTQSVIPAETEPLRNAAAQVLDLGLELVPHGPDRAFLERLTLTPEHLWTPANTQAAREALEGLSEADLGPGSAGVTPDRTVRAAWQAADGRLTISATYDVELFEEIRELPGAHYETGTKLWQVDDASEARQLLAAKRFTHQLPSSPTPHSEGSGAAAVAAHKAAGRLITYERSFRLTFDFDKELVEEIKRLDRRRWDKNRRQWVVSASPDQIHQLVEILERWDFTADERAQRRIDGLLASRKAQQAERERVDALGVVQAEHAESALEGLALRDFQMRAVKATLRRRRVLIADQQGLGKTAEALATIVAGQATPAVIVCPASLTLTWVAEAARWAPGLNARILKGTKPDEEQLSLAEGSLDLVILSYERLVGWWKTLAALKPQALVFDESHMIKEARAKRSRAALELAQAIDHSALVLLLTGTPILNGPRELIHQLRVIDQLEAFGGSHYFRERYCNLRMTHFGQDDSGASNTKELGEKLRERCMIRRRKEDVLKELPDRLPPVSVPVELKAADRKEYEKVTREAIAEYLDDSAYKRKYDEQMAAGALQENAERRAKLAGERARAAAALVLLGKLRNETSRCKTPVAINWAENFLQSGEKLVIFADSVRTQKALTEHFAERAIAITAEIPPDERQLQADRFQQDPSVRVAVCSLRAASTGLTLTAASDVLMVDLPYTAGMLEQAIDRCHRIGQKNLVTPWLLLATDTVDIDLGGLLARKLAVASEVVDGASPAEQGSIAGALVDQLLAQHRLEL